jgi:hypothetical protein
VSNTETTASVETGLMSVEAYTVVAPVLLLPSIAGPYFGL